MKQVLLGLAACSLSLAVSAQQFHCAADAMRAKLIAEDPTYLEREAAYQQEIRHLMASNAVQRDRDVLVTIPIVFHIINLNGDENITNEQILRQVELLNEDYQALNPDLPAVHPAFLPITGDVQIKFVLPTLDPNGNCTNGIDRIKTPETLKGNDQSKMNGWPRNKYLNVWVVASMNEGTAGYAYYPSAQEGILGRLVDGIIIRHEYIGNIGTSNNNNSTALTHEVGHYLNLQHVWGNNNGGDVVTDGPYMANSCGDDEVEDTPKTRGWDDCPVPYNNPVFPWTSCNDTDIPLNQFPYRFDDVTTGSGTQDPTPRTNPTDELHGESRTRTVFNAFNAQGVSANSTRAGLFAFDAWDEVAVDQVTDFSQLPGTINTGKYYAFSFDAQLSDMLTVDSLGFKAGRSANGARTFAVRSSADNYATNLPIRTGGNANVSVQSGNVAFFTGDIAVEVPTIYVDPPVTGYTSLDQPIQFRIYAWNAEGANGALRICANDASTDLFDRLGGSPQPGGTWSGPSEVVNDQFDPANMAAGTYTYTVDGNGSCNGYSAQVEVTIVAPPSIPTITGPSDFCSTASVTLTSSSATGNTWSPGAQTTASINTNKAGTYAVTVTANGCKATSEPFVLSVVAAANAGTNDALTVCSGGASAPLFNSLSGNPTSGGTWTGPSEVVDGLFDPATMSAGAYQYVVTGNGPCANATATVTVQVAATSSAGTNGTFQICRNAAPADLFDRLGGSPQSGGTWSGPSTTDGTYDPVTMEPGVYTYSVAAGGECGTPTATVTVLELNVPVTPTITSSFSSVCAGSTRVLTSSSSTGNAWQPGGQTTQNITVRDGGSYTVTVTSNGCSATSAAFVLGVQQAANAGKDGDLTICSESTALPLFNTLAGTPDMGGAWTGPSAVTDGLYDPATMAPGTYTYVVTGTGPCPNDTALVVVVESTNYAHISGVFSIDDVKVYGETRIIENVENYMEYSYCSKMFTDDQVLRMRAALNSPTGERNQTWIEENLQATGSGEYAVQCPPSADFYVRTVELNSGFNQEIPFSPTVCVNTEVQFVDNSGGAFPTSWSWTFPDGNPSTSTERNPVVSFSTPGWKAVTLTVSNDVGSHTRTEPYSVLIGGSPYDIVGMYNESFENNVGLHPWFNMNYATNNTYFQRTTTTGSQGSACAMLNSGARNPLDLIDPDNSLDYDELISPSFDLDALQSGTTFSFDFAYATGANDLSMVSEELLVSSSVDCGKTWSTLFGGEITGSTLINNGNNPQTPPPAWTTKTFNLPNSRLAPNVRFRFRYYSSAFSGNLYIDNINISGPVGIDDLSTEHFMNLFPNPTNDRFQLTVFGMDRFNTDIVITDVRGAIVYRTTHRPAGITGMEFSGRELGLSDGLYLIRATNEEGDSTQRLVVGK
ncbi:MAG: T9SS type A sorting domain-containing protein [Flavobacteriales bacterium]|nr:T9SS type A sorting domain-containing protein [Flavobacteriales bacterium]